MRTLQSPPNECCEGRRRLVFSFFLTIVLICTAARFGLAQPAQKKTAGDDSTILAVMEIEDTSGRFRPGDLSAAEDSLRTLLIKGRRYRIVDKGSQSDAKASLLEELRRESHDPCYDKNCQIVLGKKVSAQNVLMCKISQVGEKCFINCQEVCLKTELQVNGDKAEFECVAVALLDVVEGISVAFTGQVLPRLNSDDTKIVLLVEPKGGRWKLDDGVLSGTVSREKGYETIPLSPGNHVLHLESDGFVTVRREFVVGPGELGTIQETLVPKPPPATGTGTGLIELTTRVKDGAQVDTDVEDAADVYIDGKNEGKKTDGAPIEIAEGRHVLLVRRPLFKDAIVNVNVASGKVEKREVVLEPNFGDLEIRSIPPGADLYVDGVKQPKPTPVLMQRIESRAYKVKLSYSEYRELEGVVFVKVGEKTPQEFRLVPAFADVAVEVRSKGKEIGGARVLLDHEPQGEASPGRPLVMKKVRSGKHKLLVKKHLFADFARDIEVRDGQPLTVKAELNPNYGTLVVVPTPPDSQVFVDDAPFGKGRFEADLPVGEHKVVVKGPDSTYQEATTTVVVELLKRKELPVSLRQMQGSVLIATNARAALSLDGQRIGNGSTRKDGIPAGPHVLRSEQEGFIPVETRVSISDGSLEKVDMPLTPLSPLSVSCIPEGLVLLDGKEAGRNFVKLPWISEGPHKVECKASGKVGETREVVGQGPKPLMVQIRLDTPEILMARYQEDWWFHFRWGGIGALAAVLAGTGAYFTYQSYGDIEAQRDAAYDDYKNSFGSETTRLYKKIQGYNSDMQFRSVLGWSLAGTGLVLGGIATWFLVTLPDRPSIPLSTLPFFLEDGGGLVFASSF